MTGIRMVGEDVLPAGPHRSLVTAVFGLYERAGKMAVREIARLIRKDDRLPGTLSHEGVRAAITGAGSVPRWQNLEALVRVLAEHDVHHGDVDDAVLRLHALWSSASEPEQRSVSPTADVAPSSAMTMQKAIEGFGPDALSDLLLVIRRFGQISDVDIGEIVRQLDESTAELVSYVAECEFGYGLDEATPVEEWDRSVSLLVATAAYRPSSEIVQFLADQEEPPSPELLALCLYCLVARFTIASADETLRLLVGLDSANVGYDKCGLLTYCGGFMPVERMEALVTQLSAFDLSWDVSLLCSGFALRDLPEVCELLDRLRGKEGGRWAHRSIVSWYVKRRSVTDLLQLMASSDEQGNQRLMQEVSREISANGPDHVLECCEALIGAARPASLDRVLAAAATGTAPFVAEILIGLAKRRLYNEQAALLMHARATRRDGLLAIGKYLNFSEADVATMEQVRTAIEEAEKV